MADLRRRLNEWEPRLLSVLRIMAGLLFMEHGAQKLFGWMSTNPPMPSMTEMWFVGILEFFGGLLFALGLFTRVVAFLLSGLMAAAYFRAHAPMGFWPIANRGELAALYCFVFLYFVAAGAGPWSLDRLLRRTD